MDDDPTIFDLLGGTAPEPARPAPAAAADGGAAAALSMAELDAAIAALRTAGPLLPPVRLEPGPRGGRVWVYDTEVFPNLVLHVFTDGERTEVFHPGRWRELAEFLADPELVLAGFNSAAYDDPVLRFLIGRPEATVAEVYALSGAIIADRAPAELRWGPTPWKHSIDVLQLLNGRGSLKEWQCKLGMALVAESPFPFDRPVPAGGAGEVLRYCLNDVAATVALLQHNWDLVAMRAVLQGIYGQSDGIYATTEAGIAEGTLVELHRRAHGTSRQQLKAAAEANPHNRPRIWPLRELASPRVGFATPPFRAVHAALAAGSLHVGERGIGRIEVPGVPRLEFELAGTRFQLGAGGLHSVDAPGSWRSDDRQAIIDLDVTSYYPSLILNEGWYPLHYGPEFLEHLRGMRDRRVAAKKAGDKRTATALKIVINSVYGKLNDTFSAIRSVPDAFRVTFNGQLCLLMLVEGLVAAGATVLSANTDGVTVRMPRHGEPRLSAAVSAWERATGLELEQTRYRALFRRDVNNYLAVAESGELKTKGAFGDGAKGDGAVVRDAAIGWLIGGVEPAATVAATTRVQDFLFYQRARGDAVLVHGVREVGRVARWYIGFGGPPLRRKDLASGGLSTVARGHQARLAMDIAGWTMADLRLLDHSAYIEEARRLIASVEPVRG
jgi:hypothetical protein